MLERAVSSAEEHFLDMEGVRGSIPLPPTRVYPQKPKFGVCREDIRTSNIAQLPRAFGQTTGRRSRKVPNVLPGGKSRSPAPFATERRAEQKLASSKLNGNAQNLKAIGAFFCVRCTALAGHIVECVGPRFCGNPPRPLRSIHLIQIKGLGPGIVNVIESAAFGS